MQSGLESEFIRSGNWCEVLDLFVSITVELVGPSALYILSLFVISFCKLAKLNTGNHFNFKKWRKFSFQDFFMLVIKKDIYLFARIYLPCFYSWARRENVYAYREVFEMEISETRRGGKHLTPQNPGFIFQGDSWHFLYI